MIVGPWVPPGVVPVVLAAMVTCLATRWVGPAVLRALAKSIQVAVAAVAAVMILPEYWVTNAYRRRDRRPSQFAYDYSAAVGWMALVTHRVTGLLLRGGADALRAVPLPLAAISAGALMVGWLLDLITL